VRHSGVVTAAVLAAFPVVTAAEVPAAVALHTTQHQQLLFVALGGYLISLDQCSLSVTACVVGATLQTGLSAPTPASTGDTSRVAVVARGWCMRLPTLQHLHVQ
jgi:hypothetical protein